MAATTLSGLLQCNFLTMDGPMQTHFEQLCKMRLPKKRKRDLGSVVDTIPSGGKKIASETKTIHVDSSLGRNKYFFATLKYLFCKNSRWDRICPVVKQYLEN